jgi:hypothetical protein
MRIVEFSDGTFGILVKKFPKVFIDLRDLEYRWKSNSKYFHHCKGTKERVFEVFKIFSSEIIKYHKPNELIH